MCKPVLMLLSAILVLPGFMPAADGRLTVTFKSTRPVNGTTVGYQLGRFTPYGGLDIIHIRGGQDSYRERWEWDWENERLYREYVSESEDKVSGSLIVPRAGIKLNIPHPTLKAYLLGGAFMVLPALKSESQGKRIYYEPDGSIQDRDTWEDELDKETKREIKDVLDFMGLTFAAGVAYPLNENFSIGGEFGFRYLFNSATWDDDYSDVWDGEVRYRSITEQEIRGAVGGTYTSLTLNYTF